MFVDIVKPYVKYVLSFFLQFYYKTLITLKKRSKETKKYSVSICGIFKNEAPFLKEWIEYHKLLGVEHFYLYNNFSNDGYYAMLESYIREGIVTLIDWPVPQGQVKAYKNWYEKYRFETEWVSFLDIDEFICPKYATSIQEWLKPYKKYPCILLYWKMFGTSGHLIHDMNRLVTEQYVVSWPELYHTGKIFYNTNYSIVNFDIGMHHVLNTQVIIGGIKITLPPINEFGYFVKWNIHYDKETEKSTIQVNHYWSKAWDIYMRKAQNVGDVAFNKNPKSELWYFLAHEQKNISVDYTIFRFLIQLKMAMEQCSFKN